MILIDLPEELATDILFDNSGIHIIQMTLTIHVHINH